MSWYIEITGDDDDKVKIRHSETPSMSIMFDGKDGQRALEACSLLNGGDGLSKRERFAMAAMQGMQASNISSDRQDSVDNTTIAQWAVDQADLLIAELDKGAA